MAGEPACQACGAQPGPGRRVLHLGANVLVCSDCISLASTILESTQDGGE